MQTSILQRCSTVPLCLLACGLLWLFSILNPVLAQDQHAETQSLPILEDAPVRRIVIFIGDGMGLAHLTAMRMVHYGADGFSWIERMPTVGLVSTHADGQYFTDSAAGATAFSTGYKTAPRYLGMHPDGRRFRTLVDAVQERGMATGLISPRDGMTGATPSAFAVHVPERDSTAEIASQLLAASVDVLIGGNDQAFRPRTVGGTRMDGRNLIKEAQEQGYRIVHQTEELADVPATPLLGFIEAGVPSNTAIVACTRAALRLLADDPEGFLLVVESEAPDIGGHANNDTLVVDGTYQFDQAVRLALDFAAREKDTLVLVTADHETGGLSLQYPDSMASYPVVLTWGTTSHTAIPVPLFAYGPHAARFSGSLDNTDVAIRLAEILALPNFPQVLSAK